MASSNIPVRVPARPASTTEATSPRRPAVWRQDKKPSRFVIKLYGNVPC
jgi:hypothetical protein